jgi:hypothetical protein
MLQCSKMLHPKRRTKMATKTNDFDTDKYFDEYNKNARMMLMMVYPSELRSILEKTVDLQVEASKLVTKTITEAVAKIIPSK